MESYFDHFYVSNSDLKRLRHLMDPKFEDPANLAEIFEFGRLVEDVIFDPAKANWQHKDIDLAKQMAQTFREDTICGKLLLVPDLRRQHEWYRSDRYGVHARCKMDADSKLLDLVVEFKGLSVESESAFENAIQRFDYDQGLAWYMDVSGYGRALLVAVSKKSPKQLFKRLVTRDHAIYKDGVKKVRNSIVLWNQILA